MIEKFFSFAPTITENGSYYVISGITCKYFSDDLKNVYGTSVIAGRVINQLSANRMRIHKFFMLELAWILDDFINKQAKTKQRNFRVSIVKYQLLYEAIKTETWVKTTLNDYPPFPLKSVLSDFKFTPFPDQQAFLEYYSTIKYGFQLKGCLLDAAPGSGKALWDESYVLTPSGYTKMRKINVGDKVIGSDGKPTAVLEVHPQGVKQLYNVVFADGRKVVCCEEHLWTFTYNGQKQTNNTRYLMNLLAQENVSPVYIPLLNGEYDGYIKKQENDICPYVFGILLLSSRMAGELLKVSIENRQIVHEVKQFLNAKGYRLKKRDIKNYNVLPANEAPEQPIVDFLRSHGLAYSGPAKKTIPKKYTSGAYSIRLGMIQALMDLGGKVHKDGKIIFETTHKNLVKQLQTLIRSVGGTAQYSYRVPAYIINNRQKKGKLTHRLTITKNNPVELFRYSQEKMALTSTIPLLGLAIDSITPSITDSATCIKVDNPDHLFVTNDYVLTHNTFCSLVWSRMLGKGKTILLVPKHAIQDPWIEHMDANGKRYCFKQPPKYWVSTSKTDPTKSDAEFFVFYKEQMRKDEWEGMSFDRLLTAISNRGNIPVRMIIDESHNYNEISAQQTQGMVNFASHPYITDVLSMSGTPIKSAGKETYPLFCIIDPLFNEQIRLPFLKLYSRNNYFLNEMLAHRLGRIKFTINEISGMENPPTPVPIKITVPDAERFTLDNIRAQMLAYVQERIVFYNKNMPTYLYDFDGYLSMYAERIWHNKEAQSELIRYKGIVNKFRKNGFDNLTDGENSKYCRVVEKKIEEVLQLRGEELRYFRFILPAIKFLPLKLRGEALGNVLGRARIDAITACIDNIDVAKIVKSGIKKTAFYSTYIEAIEATYRKLNQGGCSPVKYYGQNKNEIKPVLDKINSSQADSIVTTYESLGDAVNLTACNNLVLLNLPWREYQLKQCIARIYRKGQDAPCFVWVLELDTGDKENINTRTRDIMSYYSEIVDSLLNKTTMGISGATLKLNTPVDVDLSSLSDTTVPSFRPKFSVSKLTDIFR